MSLHYMRKRGDDSEWVDIGDLLVPKPTHYSIWLQKLTLDRRGVLYLAYFYRSAHLADEECEAYKRKWPDETVACGEGTEEAGISSHDPVLLISGDGGDSWKIATTADIIAPWLRLAGGSLELSDQNGWDDIANYSTIQTAVVNNELYLLARANRGIETWKFDAGNNNWSRLALNDPALSDEDGWDDVANYSTIQTAVVKKQLYLLARANRGIETWKFDAGTNNWARLALNDPALSDEDGWDDVANYSTIQTAVVKNELYLLARANRGIETWKFDTGSNNWSRLTLNDPALSDDAGWDDVTNYSTIQTAVVKNELYLLARADRGIETWKFDAGNNNWSRLALNDPALSDEDGWDDVANYSTIQTAVMKNELYLLARANRGIGTWKFDADSTSWSRLALNDPALSDDNACDDITNYSTIQTAVVANELYLLARANLGIHTWKFDAGRSNWALVSVNMPVWSDAAGWADVSNYSTIQTAVVKDQLYMMARSNGGISTWSRRATVSAVQQLV